MSERSSTVVRGGITLAERQRAAPSSPLSYSLITPVLDEMENLTRLAASIECQTLKPQRWMIVDSARPMTRSSLPSVSPSACHL